LNPRSTIFEVRLKKQYAYIFVYMCIASNTQPAKECFS